MGQFLCGQAGDLFRIDSQETNVAVRLGGELAFDTGAGTATTCKVVAYLLRIRSLDWHRRALKVLEASLRDSDLSVQVEATHCLGLMGTHRSRTLLKQGLISPETDIRFATVKGLALFGGRGSRDLLLEHLREEKDPRLLAQLVQDLKGFFKGDANVTEALKDFKLPPRPQSKPKDLLPEVF